MKGNTTMEPLRITEVKIEHSTRECITDNSSPVISFALESDLPDTSLASVQLTLGNQKVQTQAQSGIVLQNALTKPLHPYQLEISVTDNHGRKAHCRRSVRTGRMGLPWSANWITDGAYEFPKKESPLPMTFRKKFSCGKELKRAFITSTAIGIYELELNGEKVGEDYFSPGYTTYRKNLQYQIYDVTKMLKPENTLIAVVGGGWAVGRFTYNSLTRITSPKQAFLLELFLIYADGTREKIVTDESWQVTEEGKYRFADFYDGEIYDATVDLDRILWKRATLFRPPIHPDLILQYGPPVRIQGIMTPRESFPGKNGHLIYDFGQNFAGVVSLKLSGHTGQKITIRHAETIFNGDLCFHSNRTAKATAVYYCREGEQIYSPRMTSMGFRYLEIEGIEPEQVTVSALVLHSDFKEIGSFSCSDERLNQIQSLIRWSGKSNFVEIPTDCPQRDERLGWTGDISIFAPTACYNFDMEQFLEKWLKDVRAEQTALGGVPFVVPNVKGLGPSVPTACWGDSCILVTWAEYESSGDLSLLEKMYPTMKRYLLSVKRWASLFSVRKHKRRIWKYLFQFGDWNAPGESVKSCMARGPLVATAYFARTSEIMSRVADLLGREKDSNAFAKLHREICDAFLHEFTDGTGKLRQEYQTGYALPLAFGIAQGETAKKMADRLDLLVRENQDHLSTGFTGTPWLLFALADHGHADTAWRLLYQDTCPSWLYEIENGATTFWEGWDNIPADAPLHFRNQCVSDSGVSFNHYAYGCVGDFLYKEVLGLRPLQAGYQRFLVKPLTGGGLTWCEGTLETPYGRIQLRWKILDNNMEITVDVPVSCTCEVVFPDGSTEILSSGHHQVNKKELDTM